MKTRPRVNHTLTKLRFQKIEIEKRINELELMLRKGINYESDFNNITVDNMVNIISEISGIDITERNRKRIFVDTRFAYFALAKKYTINSLTDIGNAVNVNHATVINGLTKHESFISINDAEYVNYYNHIALSYEGYIYRMKQEELKQNEDEESK